LGDLFFDNRSDECGISGKSISSADDDEAKDRIAGFSDFLGFESEFRSPGAWDLISMKEEDSGALVIISGGSDSICIKEVLRDLFTSALIDGDSVFNPTRDDSDARFFIKNIVEIIFNFSSIFFEFDFERISISELRDSHDFSGIITSE